MSVPGEHTRSRNQDREVPWTNHSDYDCESGQLRSTAQWKAQDLYVVYKLNILYLHPGTQNKV